MKITVLADADAVAQEAAAIIAAEARAAVAARGRFIVAVSGGRASGSDLVLRESMFGGSFGGKCTQGRHFFDENEPLYEALAALTALRKQLLPLRRGRQMLHQISGDGSNFGVPCLLGERMRSIIA
jgi:hypothetical protein